MERSVGGDAGRVVCKRLKGESGFWDWQAEDFRCGHSASSAHCQRGGNETGRCGPGNEMSVFESVQHCGEPPASAVRTVRNTRMPFPHTVQGCAVVSSAWRLNARHRTQDLPDGVDSGLLARQIILCILQYIGTRGGQSRDDFRAQNQQTACLASQQHMSTAGSHMRQAVELFSAMTRSAILRHGDCRAHIRGFQPASTTRTGLLDR